MLQLLLDTPLLPLLLSLALGFVSIIANKRLHSTVPATTPPPPVPIVTCESPAEKKFREHRELSRSAGDCATPIATPKKAAAPASNGTTSPLFVPADELATLKATVEAPTPPTPAAKPAAGAPAFEFLESVVTEEGTGERLSASVVHRGSSRCERLIFRVNTPLTRLKRVVHNFKHFPMVGYQKVGVEEVMMGDYPAQPEPQFFDMPLAKIPNMYLARGKYRIDLWYFADSHPGKELTYIKHDFEVF